MVKPIRPSRVLKTSHFKRDPSHRIHFIQSANIGTACQRFEYLQTVIIEKGLEELDSSSLVLGCLLAFDGLSTENNLQGAYTACASAIRWHGEPRIDWLDGPRINARHLSSLTTLALGRVSQWEPFEQAKDHLLQYLERSPFGQAIKDHSETPWNLLLSDSMAWLQAALPPVLFGHVSGAAPLSALPRSALARDQMKLALKIEPSESPTEPEASNTAYARAFEAVMLGQPSSTLAGNQFIKKIIVALTPPSVGARATKRARILEQLRLLAAEIDRADEVSALLYLFALDLVDNGTRRKSDLAPTTPYDYVQSFAIDFHAAASGLRLTGIDTETYTDIFRGLLHASKANASYRVAGLKAFHLFLRAWWSVPRLPADVFKVEIDARVHANMVWPHEQVRLRQWFADVDATRFTHQLHCALEIASNAMVRIRELLVLRLMNVIDEGEHLVIEVAREIRDGKEKSSEGRRRVFIHDTRAVELIRSWLARRLQEQAGPTEYLFGDPSDPATLAHSGTMYFWLNRLLKSATGDDSISLHCLRRSIASPRLAFILESDDEHEINPLDTLANEAGHVGGHVTAANYCHLFESGLRRALDTGLLQLLQHYDAVSAWSGIASSTLRQRVRRGRMASSHAATLACALKEAAGKVVLPDVSAGCAFDEPPNPLKQLRTKSLGYTQILGALSDVARGLSISQTSLRQDLSEELVTQALVQVGEFADRHGAPELEMPDLLTLGMKSLRDASGELLGLRPDFARTSHSRWILLMRAIQRCDGTTLTGAVQYWQRALSGKHLAVRPGAGWDQFITLLSRSSINTSQVALKFSCSDNSNRNIEATVALAQATLHLHLGRTAREYAQTPRAGRPPIWVVIGSDVTLLDKDGSANSMVGLHCCMLAAYVWLYLLPPD